MTDQEALSECIGKGHPTYLDQIEYKQARDMFSLEAPMDIDALIRIETYACPVCKKAFNIEQEQELGPSSNG